MSRTPEQIVADLATAARLADFGAGQSWYDVLFDATATEPRLAVQDAPDQALLLALAEEYVLLGKHVDTLPERTHIAWLEEILAIPRLPVVPDRVVAHAQVDPKLAPAVIPRGTLLRGGKDAFGNERRYATVDALTAHGAALVGVRSLTPGGESAGLPGQIDSAPEMPLTPRAGSDAPHRLRIHSPALVFDGGNMTVELEFLNATGVSGLDKASWTWSVPEDVIPLTRPGNAAGSKVTIELLGCCAAPDGGSAWIECEIPSTLPVPESLAFDGVRVRVVARTPFVPEGAFYNDGAVDVTKEFQPFGAVAKRGDAFYVRSDEAFGKQLASLSVEVRIMQEGGAATLSASYGGSGIPGNKMIYLGGKLTGAKNTAGMPSGAKALIDEILGWLDDVDEPTVIWQRRSGREWFPIGSEMSSFGSVLNATVAGGSDKLTVSGQEGHYIRAFLSQGDFGWTKYQEDIADFATKAVDNNPSTKPTMQPPPVPPIASSITISYTTAGVAATRVEAISGWRRTVKKPSGTYRPFRLAVSDSLHEGMVAVGLELPASALGSSVSLYFDVDSASPCGSSAPVVAAWEWWDGEAWQDLAVADGSRQLRESGLLRFVAPFGWEDGCPDLDAPAGRWIRLVTHASDRLGVVQNVVVDAVLAEFISRAADPSLDPSSATALQPGTIKGALSPIRGVKKVTNLASVRGRGPETDPAYRVRASARARHRDRAIAPWDYEQHVALAFPEVAAVRCLPHTDASGVRVPGKVGLVVVPDRLTDPAPRPSVSLTGRIVDALTPIKPMGAEIAVLCPLYREVRVVASILLRRGVAALTGLEDINAALERTLHPIGTAPTRWGKSLYASTLVAFLEQQPSVDVVELFRLEVDGFAVEIVEVDPCRGLYCSSGDHRLTCEEQL